MCRSGTQVELPRRLAMSQVGLVDDHTLHQPCVQSLSFKSTLALWMPAHWTPSLWPTVAIPQRKKWHLPGGRITSGDLPLRTHTHTHGRTHTHAYYMIVIARLKGFIAVNLPSPSSILFVTLVFTRAVCLHKNYFKIQIEYIIELVTSTESNEISTGDR